jgi:peptidase C39-like protein
MNAAAAIAASAAVWVLRFPQPLTHDYQSQVHLVPAGFSSAIASWNAQTSGGSWIDVGMRARIGSRWTTWYAMGHWSAMLDGGHRTSLNGQHDGDGRVDTDTLVLHHIADAIEIRARMHPATAGDMVSISLLAVTVDREPDHAYSPPPALKSAAWGVDIPVPERTQRVGAEGGKYGGGGDSWCSPTSVSMIMAYWASVKDHPEWDVSVADAAAGTFDPAYQGCGNWPFNIAYATRHGLEGWVARLPSLAAMEPYLTSGVPVIASIRVKKGELDGAPYPSTDGHLLVVRGFTDGGDVIVNDPYGEPGAIRRVYNRAQFERVWQDGSHGAVYLIGPAGALPD